LINNQTMSNGDVAPDLIKLETIEKLPEQVKSIVVLEQDIIAVGTYGENIIIYDLTIHDIIRKISTSFKHIGIMNKIGRDHLAASHNYSNELNIFNWRTGQHFITINNVQLCWGRENPILFTKENGDSFIIAGQRNPNLLVIGFPSGQISNIITTTYLSIYCVLAVTTDIVALGGVGANNVVQLRDLDGDIVKKNLEGHTGPVFTMCKVYYHVIATGSFDGSIRIWNWMTGQCLQQLSGSARQVAPLFGRYLISGGDDMTLKIWDVREGNCLKTVYGHLAEVLNVSDLGGGRMISASEEKLLRVWRWRHPKDTKMIEVLYRLQKLRVYSDVITISV
jgi:hypothetical protein